MLPVEELRNATANMTAPALLRFLLFERFPKGCAVTTSVRIRSIVVLKMIAEIDRSVPVVFCHACYVYPESADYRAQIIRRLGLTDVRDPGTDETDVLPDDQDHFEEIRSSVWGSGAIETILHLNKSLAGFECWISAAYNKPYPDHPAPRLIQEGRMLRVDPLNGWSREEVHAYMAKHDLPRHPSIVVPSYHY
jgi:phosphoadenosine phosphosulfate reductase